MKRSEQAVCFVDIASWGMKMEIPHSKFHDWIWPVAMVHDNPPIISDGYGKTKRSGRGHFGADIMHPRRPGLTENNLHAVGSKLFVTYQGEQAIAAADAMVQDVGSTRTGHYVRLMHRVGVEGIPILSVYRHLQTVLVAPNTLVSMGTALGVLGDDPSNPKDPIHLHFELWDISKTRLYPGATFDPSPVMKVWRVKRIPQADFVNHPRAALSTGG
jgi:murein DD-endopeptidase MepM/ murein hydrolase activator NlpD